MLAIDFSQGKHAFVAVEKRILLLRRADVAKNDRLLSRFEPCAKVSMHSDPKHQWTMTMPASIPLGISAGLARLPIG